MNVSIGKHIYTALAEIEGLTIYPVVAAFNNPAPTTPFAVYQRTSTTPDYTKSLFVGDITHSYSVTVVDNDYDHTVELAQLAIDRLMALSHTDCEDIRFGQVMMTDLSEDFQEGLFLQHIQFEINTQAK